MSGWPRGQAGPDAGDVNEYENGIYFMNAGSRWNGTWTSTRMETFDHDFQVEVVGRVLGENPNAPGNWGISVGRADGRGIHVLIDRQSRLGIVSSLGAEPFPIDRLSEPIRHEAIRPADQFNTMTLRVHNRSIEVLVNDVLACEPIALDWDLLPASAAFGLGKPNRGTRIRTEFDRVQLRKLLPD